MTKRDDRNEQVQYLLEEVFFSGLESLENELCQHQSTEDGYYAGALAAIAWTRKGTVTLEPGDASDAMLRLERFVQMLKEDKAHPQQLMTKDAPSA